MSEAGPQAGDRALTGAEAVVATLLGCGIDTCIANPGTSELHLVAAFDRIPGVRCILGLAEGVVTGAADGYGRMSDRPAVTLLHCGPGLANGLANLHNARRAATPVVNIVGDHTIRHLAHDPPLAADIESWARPVSAWYRSASDPATVGADVAEAVRAALEPPGRIATLVLPADVAWSGGATAGGPMQPPPPAPAEPETVAAAARVLRGGGRVALLLGGRALRAGALAEAHRVAAATGAEIWAAAHNARVERGRGRHPVSRLPYAVDEALAALAGLDHLVLVAAAAPVAFFQHPGKPSRLVSDHCAVHTLVRPGEAVEEALRALGDAVGARPVPPPDPSPPAAPGDGPLTPESVAALLAARLPEDAIVADEGVSFGRRLFNLTRDAARHDWLQLTGGAIGLGPPMAAGAALAAPGRRVVSLQADGAALYSLQALWTQARERLDVTTLIFANRSYAILRTELANVGAAAGPIANALVDLSRPAPDWVRLAEGFGVEAARADTLAGLDRLLARANGRPGPFLIEVVP
ncbi:MAG: acetolactate synthase large subunit [Rhodobacteraceae bacterium]|jgi:acetolactate synthase-1/2/3 large subunit|nr:acetolactate synthase large subunit [Paracoccaceae bacterium]